MVAYESAIHMDQMHTLVWLGYLGEHDPREHTCTTHMTMQLVLTQYIWRPEQCDHLALIMPIAPILVVSTRVHKATERHFDAAHIRHLHLNFCS